MDSFVSYTWLHLFPFNLLSIFCGKYFLLLLSHVIHAVFPYHGIIPVIAWQWTTCSAVWLVVDTVLLPAFSKGIKWLSTPCMHDGVTILLSKWLHVSLLVFIVEIDVKRWFEWTANLRGCNTNKSTPLLFLRVQKLYCCTKDKLLTIQMLQLLIAK